MKRWALTITLLTASFAHAETALDGCAMIDADLDRLACYDEASGRTAKTTTPLATDDTGKWNVNVKTSKFEDTTDVYLSLKSNDNVACRSYSTPAPVQLWIRCLENTTSLFIATDNCHLASRVSGYGDVDMRTDGDKTRTVSMDASTDSRALGIWSGNRAIPAAIRLFEKEVLLVRFTPYNQSPVTAEFDISGLKNAIKPLREACGW